MDVMMPGHGLFGLAVLAMAVLGYFLPAVVAYSRRHHNRLAILALNFLLGWTFLGWVVALVWSLTAVRRDV